MKILTKASLSPEPTQRELDNLKVAYSAACEGMVLLKNDGALPFKDKRVALYGPGASMTIKGGTGSGEVNERHSVTILEGMENRKFDILTMDWIRGYEEMYAAEKEAYTIERRKRFSIFKLGELMNQLLENFRAPSGPAITEKADTENCLYVLSRQAGEGGDRRAEKGDYFLTDEEEAAIRFCAANYENFVLVINCGSGMDMTFADEIPGINAILYIAQLGTEGGNAFALSDLVIDGNGQRGLTLMGNTLHTGRVRITNADITNNGSATTDFGGGIYVPDDLDVIELK